MSALADIRRPVELGQVHILISPATGEIIDWRGLNTSTDRCPATGCTGCPARCRCAPCRCDRCHDQKVSAAHGGADDRRSLVLF